MKRYKNNYKIQKFESYTVISNNDNTKHIAIVEGEDGRLKFTKINSEILDEFIIEKKIKKSHRHEYDRHIEHSQLTEASLNARMIKKDKSIEDDYIEKEGINYIIRAIWKLPEPQNRRVYMHIVDGLSFSKIAMIEERHKSVIKRSIESGLRNLRKNLKHYYFTSNF